MKILTPAPRRVLILTLLGLTCSAWGQDAVPAPAAEPTPAAPSANPAASVTSPDRILPQADPNTPAAATLAGVLSGNSTAVSTIQRQELPQREKLLGEISERVQTAEQRVADLRRKATGLNPDGQKALERALADYDRTKAKLQQSLEASRAAVSNTWERARSTLATDFAFFVAAAAGVELASPNT